MMNNTMNMTNEAFVALLENTRSEWKTARARWETAKEKDWRDAEEVMDFWSNKLAFLTAAIVF